MQKVISNSFRSIWRVAPAAILRKTTPVLRSLNYSLPMYSFSTATPNDSTCDKTCNKKCSECHKLTMCWNCHHFTEGNERFCPSCHKIQPVYSLEEGGCNYFQLFGLPETYDIDPAKLESNFKNLQKVIHPDLFTNKSDEEKAVSAKVSTTINIAHNKLKNKISRAAYLVKLTTGNDVLAEEDNFKIPMEMLMEVMEIREKISDSKSKEETEKLKQQVLNTFKEHENAFRCALCKKDEKTLCNEAVAMKYYDNIIREFNGELG